MENLEKLRQKGAVVGDRLRISLQYLPPLSGQTYQDMEQELRGEFGKLAPGLAAVGVEVEPDSLSVTGQTIEALVAPEKYEALTNALDPSLLRADLLVSRDATMG
jgi:hypothetical protein